MFHRFHKKKYRAQGPGSLNQVQFENILKYVGLKNIISPDIWIKKLKNKTLKKNEVCITLDDGLKSQYDCALPILEKYNIKAFWFVFTSVLKNKIDFNEYCNYLIFKNFKNKKDEFCRDFIKKNKLNNKIFKTKNFNNYLKYNKKYCTFYSNDEIRYRFVRNFILSKNEFEKQITKYFNLKKYDFVKAKSLWMNIKHLKKINKLGHTIGMHSDTHSLKFHKLSFREQKKEYSNCYKFIQKLTKQKPLSMSHPLGSYNANTLKILRKLNIVCGFRSALNLSNKKKYSNLEILRKDPIDILNELKNN